MGRVINIIKVAGSRAPGLEDELWKKFPGLLGEQPPAYFVVDLSEVSEADDDVLTFLVSQAFMIRIRGGVLKFVALEHVQSPTLAAYRKNDPAIKDLMDSYESVTEAVRACKKWKQRK